MIRFGSYIKDYLEYVGMTQTELAYRLNISQKHMNEIINGKTDMSLELMQAIANITGIDINFISRVETKAKLEKELLSRHQDNKQVREYIQKFKPLELEKRKWITLKDTKDIYQTAFDIVQFLGIKDFNALNSYKKMILFKEDSNNIELLSLWIARCDKMTKDQTVGIYQPANLLKIISEINEYVYVNKSVDEVVFQKILNQYGIYFVVEDALDGTMARGAFRIINNQPAIYLTRRYQQVDGMIYALFHELGHVKSDYNQGKGKVIIEGTPTQEERSNQFAKDAMIPSSIYKHVRNNPTEGYLKKMSEDKRIPMCYLVSRLAKDGIIMYNSQLYNQYVETLVNQSFSSKK